MKISSLNALAAALALVVLAGCSSATNASSGGSAPVAKSATVYDLGIVYSKTADTATKHPGITIQIKPSGATGITKAVVTFAVNTAALNGGLDGSSWKFNNGSGWAKAWAPGTNSTITAGTWLTATLNPSDISTAYAAGTSSGTTANAAGTNTTVTSVDQDVELDLWSTWTTWADIASGHVYIKSIVLTYSDASVETITPDTTLVGSGTNSWRIGYYTPNSGTDGMTVTAGVISTVAF